MRKVIGSLGPMSCSINQYVLNARFFVTAEQQAPDYMFA